MTIGYAWLVLVITRGLHHTPAQLLLTDSYNGKDSRATFGLYCIIISPTYRHIRIRLTNKAMLEQKKVGKLKKWKHFFSKKNQILCLQNCAEVCFCWCHWSFSINRQVEQSVRRNAPSLFSQPSGFMG